MNISAYFFSDKIALKSSHAQPVTREQAPQPMPFQIIVVGNYSAIQNVVNAFERSARPFQIQTMELSGDQNQLTLNLAAQTYWQPAKNLNITAKVVQ
jgi:Tfp pilus assembly protein PilO